MERITINKQYADKIYYESKDVLADSDDRIRRKVDLNRALILGNSYKSHVKLVVKDKFRRRLVIEATVWAVTEYYVIVKGNKPIPIKSIEEVLFG